MYNNEPFHDTMGKINEEEQPLVVRLSDSVGVTVPDGMESTNRPDRKTPLYTEWHVDKCDFRI